MWGRQIVTRCRTFILRRVLLLRVWRYKRIYGMDLAPSVQLGSMIVLDKMNPHGVHIGAYSYITSGVVVTAHDHSRRYMRTDTYIGKRVLSDVGH